MVYKAPDVQLTKIKYDIVSDHTNNVRPLNSVRLTDPRHHLRTCVPEAGGRLNKKDGLTRYGDSHVKDKTS